MKIFHSKVAFAIIVLLCCAWPVLAAPEARPEMVLQVGHSDEVDSLAFTSDSRWLASGGRAQIKIWNAQTGELWRTFVSGDNARELAWSPDNEILAAGGYDTVTLWKRDGALLRTLPSTRWHAKTRWGWRDITNRVEGLAFSPDGSTLAVTGSGVELWNVKSGRMIRRISNDYFEYTKGVAFSSDGKRLGVSTSEAVWLFDAKTFAFESKITDAKTAPVWTSSGSTQILFSTDGKALLVQSGKVRRWLDIATRKLKGEISGLNERTWEATYSDNRKFVAYSTMDSQSIKIWNLETGQMLPLVRDLEIESGKIALSPDGSVLVAVTWANRDLQIWNTATARSTPVPRHSDFLYSLAWSPDESTLAIGSENVHLLNWPRLDTRRVLSRWQIPIGNLKFSPDEKTLYSYNLEHYGNILRTWDLKTGKGASRLLPNLQSGVSGVAISWRRNLIAVAVDGRVQTRDFKTGKILHSFKGFDTEVPSLAFSPSGDLLAGPNGRGAQVWDVRTGRLLKILNGCSGGTVHIAFSPDGKWLAARAHDSGAVHLWSTATWKLHVSLTHGMGCHDGFVFSPDSQWVALGTEQETFVHECATGKQIATLPGNASYGFAEFSNDGKFLAVASNTDAGLKFWRTGSWELVATLKQWPAEKKAPPAWIAYTPEGYYTGSKDCEKYIRWRVGEKLLPAAEYSAKFRKAALVQKALKG